VGPSGRVQVRGLHAGLLGVAGKVMGNYVRLSSFNLLSTDGKHAKVYERDDQRDGQG